MPSFCALLAAVATVLLTGALPAAADQGTPPAEPQGARPTVLRRTEIAVSPDNVVVLIAADGPLPVPSIGTAVNPSRIFLDLANVRPGNAVLSPKGGGFVQRVRWALNSEAPLVTRVVVDLDRDVLYTVETTERMQGRLIIVLEASGAISEALSAEGRRAAVAPPPKPPTLATPPPATAPVGPPSSTTPATPPSSTAPATPRSSTAPSAPPPSTTPAPGPVDTRPAPPIPGAAAPDPPMPAPPAPSPRTNGPPPVGPLPLEPAPVSVTVPAEPSPPVRPPSSAPAPPVSPPSASPAPRAPEQDVRKYAALAEGLIQRLEDLRPLLVSIDRRIPVPSDSLEAASGELRAIRTALNGVQTPRTVRATHDLLIRAVALALTATTTRLDASRTGSVPGEWNAASAAAGALMLLDRVNIDIGRPAPARR